MRTSLIAFALLACFTVCAWGQPDQLLSHERLDVWGTKDGLPPQDITAIVQTPDGYIWLGTASGLLRFDGQNFTLYDSHNTPSLISSLISALGVGPDGTLWVGIEWAGFGTFKNGVYHRVSPPDPHWNVTNGFYFDVDGSVWAFAHGTYALMHVVDGVAKPVFAPRPKDILNVDFVIRDSRTSLIGDIQGKGLWRIDNAGHPLPCAFANRMPSVYLKCAAYDAHGDLWIGSDGYGVCRIHGSTVTTFSDKDGLAANAIQALLCDKSGNLWIGTTNGISRWDGHRFTNFGKSDGLNESTVQALASDREGDLWVGAGGALHRFGGTKIVPVRIALGTELAMVRGIAPHTAGGVWIATNKGLWNETSVGEAPTRLDAFGDNEVAGVADGGDGSVWAWQPLNGGQMQLNHLDHGKLTSVQVDPRLNCAVEQAGRPVLFAGDNMYRTDGRTVSKPTPIDAGGFVFTGVVDLRGTIWLGTNNGLVRVDGDRSRPVDAGLPTGAHVLSVDVDVDGSLWLGSDHGLVHFAAGHGTVYGTADGLPDDNLFEVMSTTAGAVWCGCHAGLFTLRKQDLASYRRGRSAPLVSKSFEPADGVLSSPISFDHVKSSDGSLWFAGETAVMHADPAHMPINRLPPPVSITRADVDGHFVSTGLKSTRIPPGPGRLEVQYAGMSFVAPERVRFRYRLRPLDARWIDAGDRRAATYTNLAPGHYVFEVVACNNDGVWNYQGASMSFDIAPHFYQTQPFKVLIACLVVVAIVLTFRVQTRRLAERARQLELLVRDRTVDLMSANERLSDAHQELAAQNELLQGAQAELEIQNEELADMQAELESQNQELTETQAELETANQRLRDLATTDGLTGLKNHRSFREQLDIEWARIARTQQPLSVILMDVDQFKKYNDTFGHPAGDDVLRTVGAILRAQAREGDFVARYGGEEFVVLLPNTDVESSLAVAERFRSAIEQHGWTLRAVSGSFGVVTHTIAVSSTDELIAAADKALYSSKESGRNRVTHHSRKSTAAQEA